MAINLLRMIFQDWTAGEIQNRFLKSAGNDSRGYKNEQNGLFEWRVFA